jgi:hypothetical protein
VTVTAYDPGVAVLATVKKTVLRLPLEMEHVGLAGESKTGLEGLLVTEHVVSVSENPLPVICTLVPTSPDVGVRVIVGVGLVKTKDAEATSKATSPVSITV